MRISEWRVRRFLLVGLAVIAVVAGGFAAFNYHMDPLGVFGKAPSDGIEITIENERFCKYLLAQKYIPNNFEAILLGGSVSDNYPVHNTADRQRIYNASLNAGNVQEILPLLNEATRSGEIKTAYLCLHPYLVKNSYYKTNLRMQGIGKEAWGSISMLKIILSSSGLFGEPTVYNNAFGVLSEASFLPAETWWPYYQTAQLKPPEAFYFDPSAAGQLATLAQICQERNVRLVPFLAPRPTLLYDRFERQAMDKLVQDFESHLGMTVLNPNTDPPPGFAELMDQPDLFRDRNHLTEEGANKVWDVLFPWLLEKASID